MADAVVGQVYLVSARGSYAGQRIIMTHTYRLDAVGDFVSVELMCATLMKYIGNRVGDNNIWEEHYLNLLPPQYTLERFRIQCIAPTRFVAYDFLRGEPGAHGGDTETGNQSVALTFRTDFSGRNMVATKHIGPIPQDVTVQDNGEVVAAYKLLLADLGEGMKNSINDLITEATFTPVIYHGPAPALESTKITSYVVGETLRVQRRRTVRLGE